MDYAFKKIVKYVQFRCFGAAVELLSKESPDEFDSIIKRLYSNAKDPDSSRQLNELKTLRNLRPCVGLDNLLRVEGRLENASFPGDNSARQTPVDKINCFECSREGRARRT